MTSPRMTSPHSPFSQELDEARLTNSRSLPGSPTLTKRRLSDVCDAESPESQLSLESMMKNFEKFAQHQWPTWAKRRGWVANDEAVHDDADDDADRVIQLEKDKWIFQRKRKSHSSAATTPTSEAAGELETEVAAKETETETETEAEEEKLEQGAGKMVDILHVEETRTGQRSRRSSGYASACSSPSFLVKKASGSDAASASAELDELEKWRTSLYEVTLRWMFDAQPQDWSWGKEDADEKAEEASADAVETIAHHQLPADCKPVRIHLHLFQRQWTNKSPSFIDFCPAPSGSELSEASDHRQLYVLVFQNGSAAPHNSFPRETTCSELIQVIIECHPFLLQYEANKLALYEKCWRSGKTSRARLRRLNDNECPLILANQWLQETQDLSGCARTLVLQESQNGDIPWTDFTVAELSSFLRVLEREEANHELQIRERYQLMNKRLLESMQQSDPSLCRHQNTV